MSLHNLSGTGVPGERTDAVSAMRGGCPPWHGGAESSTPRSPVEGTIRADVAIVGAGITGLSTAATLAALRPDLDVVVVDAGGVAAGASGSGTGLVGPRVGPSLHRLRRTRGDEIARAAHRWSQAAVAHVLETIADGDIECGLSPGTQLVVASDRRAAKSLLAEGVAARALGVEAEVVAARHLPAAASRYLGGVRYGPAATVDPAAYTHGLARMCERRGVRVFEHSRVRRVEPERQPVLVTDRGRVVARRVVLAVNAFARQLDASSNVIALRVQAGATDPLPADVIAVLESLRTEPVIEHGDLSPYYRLTPDDRLVVGGGSVGHGSEDPDGGSRAFLDAAVRSLHPALRGQRIVTTWSGPIAMTRDGFPVVGSRGRDEAILHAGGCCGHGIASSSWNGAYLARWIATGHRDDLSDRFPWVRTSGPWIPSGRIVDRVLAQYLRRMTGSARSKLVT
ncbi:NAD(P)/FAD-dependent oxidoreductase [Rhodococcus triatomae]|nr:oxidoreductase [Rhodococcus triatomae BKS 15-14]